MITRVVKIPCVYLRISEDPRAVDMRARDRCACAGETRYWGDYRLRRDSRDWGDSIDREETL